METITTLSLLADYYRESGYVPHYNRIDAEVAVEDSCEKCGGNMRYIGLMHELGVATSYVAISHCDRCGHEYEF
jgi:hypothetical protein